MIPRQQYMDELDETHDFDDSVINTHIRNALQSVFTDDSSHYSELVSLFHNSGRLSSDDIALFVTSLKAISASATCIDSNHHIELLDTVLNMSLWNYDPAIMDALVELIVSLAVSSGKFVDVCLGMLVCNFMPPREFLHLLDGPKGIARKELVLVRVHSALERIADLIPLAPTRLGPIVRERMPRAVQRSMQRPVMVMFMENVLKLESTTIGELVGRSMLISSVVDLLIDYDVEIGWDDILQENLSKGIFELELEDEQIADGDDDDGFGGKFGKESCGQKRLWKHQVSDNLDKLDSLMLLVFEHLKFCKENGRLTEVFECFLHSFQSTILTAFKSKFAQFVIFYACSLDPDHCGIRFSELLADIYVNRNFPTMTRMSAVAYLASYLSRGRFVKNSSVMHSLERLAEWCSDYCGSHNGNYDPIVHRIFYSGCQAILYVLCFRMRSIMDIPHLNSQLSRLPLRLILKNPLQPLKVCLPSIVEEFVHQADAFHLVDESGPPGFDDLLDSDLSKAFGGIERLDAFFPFDPCLLKKCDSYIRPNFICWSMVRKANEDDDEGNSDDDVEEVIYPDMNGAEVFEEGDEFDEFNDSLNKMSITPKDSFLKRMQMPSRLRPSMSPESM